MFFKFQYQASLIRLCLENSQPLLIYGDIGVGKSTLTEV